jgi:hypothetical protein
MLVSFLIKHDILIYRLALQNNIQQTSRVWENESFSKMISMQPFSGDFKE